MNTVIHWQTNRLGMNTSKVFILAALVRLFPKKDAKKEVVQIMAAFSLKPEFEHCPEVEIEFVNESTNATDFVWDFGDGNISTEQHPIHAYDLPGYYKIKLIAMSDQGSDSIKKTICIQ